MTTDDQIKHETTPDLSDIEKHLRAKSPEFTQALKELFPEFLLKGSIDINESKAYYPWEL